MDLSQFKELCRTGTHPPRGTPILLQALWLDSRGDWDGAHRLAQGVVTRDGSWVHAYLHRKEGDHYNAGYWYQRASRPACLDSLEKEWETLALHLLAGKIP